MNGQLTGLNWQYTSYPGYQVLNLEYNYSTTQNNGQITQMVDGISGETVSYAYDALKRLISASSAPTSGSTPTAWTQAFGYDGFGNMTSKTLNGGANMAPAVNPTTNRLTSGYDANGNMLTGFGLTMTYDGRNRVASATPTYSGTEYYGYAPDNKRIYRWNPTTGTEEWTFYGAKGERIGTFALNTSGTYSFGETVENIWFGKKLISRVVSYGGAGALMVVRDRLGTDRETGARYYPYGDEITSTANGLEKYGTYVRDSFTTMDYADQRYYASSYGRFNSVDPEYGGEIANPISMNLYNYTLGDPVNSNDPRGLDPAPTCGSSVFLFDGIYQGTLSFIMGGISNQAIMAQTIYAESGHGPNVDTTGEELAIGEVIMNRWAFVNGDSYLFSSPVAPGSRPLSAAGWGAPGDSIYSIVENPSQFAVYQTNANGTVSLTASAQNNITSALNSSATSSACSDLAWALTVSFGLWDARGDIYVDDGLVLTSFNSFNPPHASDGYSQSAGGFGDANTFYGVPESYVSDTLPPPAPRRQPRQPPIGTAPPRPPRVPPQ